MADIRPFAALHYNLGTFGQDLSKVIAPPYDVLNGQQLAHFAGKEAHNIVHIDLPFFPPGKAGPDEVYQAANRKLQEWVKSQALVQDKSPRYYRYRQEFTYDGAKYTRLCVFAVLRLSAFGTGQVHPHEQTFGGPIADRLALMQATGCQLSPIFGLVQIPLHEMLATIPAETSGAWQADLDGVHHEVTPISDTAAIEQLRMALAPMPVYIADGHHRYKTALAYRDWLTEQNGGSLPEDHPANFVMLGVMAMEDPGNLVLPTHRVVEGLTAERLMRLRKATANILTWQDLGNVSGEAAEAELARQKGKAFVFASSDGHSHLAVLLAEELPAEYAPDRSAAFRQLALSSLHKQIVEGVLDTDGGDAVTIRYTHDTAEAYSLMNDQTGVILVQPCTMGELMAVCNANDTMPQKSTYFYPKLGTGLVVNNLQG